MGSDSAQSSFRSPIRRTYGSPIPRTYGSPKHDCSDSQHKLIVQSPKIRELPGDLKCTEP